MKSKNLLRPINAENNVYVKIPETFDDEADGYEYVFNFSDNSYLRWSGNLNLDFEEKLSIKKNFSNVKACGLLFPILDMNFV